MKKMVDSGSGLFVGMWWTRYKTVIFFLNYIVTFEMITKYKYKFIKDLATLCTVYIIATDLLML